MIYDHKKIEAKWREVWEKEEIYKTSKNPKKKKYILDMFPYPSGATMHVGHLEGYVATDILSRFYRMRGYDVLHPMGWDAFGLPAENYAIKTGIHPDKSTHDNIKIFKKQLDVSGLSYDWDYEIDTSSPEFYKWTQTIFIKMWQKGLAYKKKAPVNWCPKDETVLANEQVVDGKCERCDTPVIQKELNQWFLKITDYADRLISGLDGINWPEEVKLQQKNWIGRSEGRIIKFDDIEVFTTRPETVNSATFIAVAGESDKFTGRYVTNPATDEKIPVWEASYVMLDYGTGAIMGVPAYDERDLVFAKKNKIKIVKKPYTKKLIGEPKVNYHLRDWLVSRQRYWGCPIPMVYCKDHDWQAVKFEELPVTLPNDVDYNPRGKSPNASSKTFQEGAKCPICGKKAKREVDTMDTYVDSSWYFVRFVDPKNNNKIVSVEASKKWLPVDEYVGGGHVVQHLLFARFFWKFMHDEGLVDKSLGDEPFLKLRAPGWILGPDSRKMSKRWGNVVTPDDIIPKFGADTLRVYEMFMGPFDVVKVWNLTGVEGANRFLKKVWRLFQLPINPACAGRNSQLSNNEINYKLHKTVKSVTEDIENYKFNTAIAKIMEFVNVLTVHSSQITVHKLGILAQLLAPFAPHIAEELWQNVLKQKGSVHASEWPEYDEKYLVSNEMNIAVQVNGKLRGQITVPTQIASDELRVKTLAKKNKKVAKWIESGRIKKEIFVPNKLINFVV
jgi:leucyl-tRNA synthetase